MKVDDLIADMQAVKQANPTLEIQDILKIFEIHAINE